MAIIREAKEEIDININEKDLELIALIHPYQEGYINVFFLTNKYEGIPKIMEKEKCSNLQWFNIYELPENTIERNKYIIENIENRTIYDDGDFSIHK